MTAADLGRAKDAGAGSGQQVRQLHRGVKGRSSSLGRRGLPGIRGAPRPLLGSLKQPGLPTSSQPPGQLTRERTKQSGQEGPALFFSFLTEKGSGAPRPSLGGQEEGHHTRLYGQVPADPTRLRGSLLVPGGTAVTETVTL